MRDRLLRALKLSLAVLAAAPAVPAQASELTFAIPFRFVVNDQTLAPGRYHVTSEWSTLLVRGYKDGAAVMTIRAESGRDSAPRLVFHRYGERYVLAEAWMDNGSGRVIPASRAERELMESVRREGSAKAAEQVVVPTP
jgi:hypothetical protein